MKSRRIIKLTVTLLVISFMIYIAVSCHKSGKDYTFETAVVKKGSIINTITATGTVEADTTVLIGTQVSGVIKKIYVDFNSHVKKNQLLAELDKTPLITQVQQAEASLDDSKSEVDFQKATYERYQALLDKKLVAQADYDQVKYNYDKAKANLKTAQAGYDKAKVNLSYASIFSPIIGVVLNRAVDQGQTVAASFSTPNLFTIGNDLTQMQVQAAVDEADIGQLRQGQPVSFTVDAYPTETFKGDVRQIRLQPVVTSNVVTYTVIVNAPNPDLKLMPGMTANITVLVQKLDSVLIIPGKALRFTPDGTWLTAYYKNNPLPQRPGMGGTGGQSGAGNAGVTGGAGGTGGQSDAGNAGVTGGAGGTGGQSDAGNAGVTGGAGGTGGQGGAGNAGVTGGTGGTGGAGGQGQSVNSQRPGGTGAAGQSNTGGFQAGGQSGKKPVVVWVKTGDKVHRTRIVTGAIDGTNAEIKSGLNEGDEIILSMTLAGKATAAAPAATTSPFMPTRPGGRR